VIYAFNSAGLELMRAAKEAGLKTILEQTSAPRALELKVLIEGKKKYPEWADESVYSYYNQEFIAREEEEWKYADFIICGSRHVVDGIVKRGGPGHKCHVVPYGVDDSFKVERSYRLPGPIRVLTVGHVSLPKGAPVVWDIAREVGANAEFRMVGHVSLADNILAQKPKNVTLTNQVPRSEILQHYRWADIFLLPSLSEGSATVTYEAMRAGLPVICTPETGSVVTHGIDGFLIPTFDVEAAAKAINDCSENPEFLHSLQVNAAEKSSDLSLEAYRQRLLSIVETL
jgi:glycosyltransferase involved in cell wall biosynthesis